MFWDLCRPLVRQLVGHPWSYRENFKGGYPYELTLSFANMRSASAVIVGCMSVALRAWSRVQYIKEIKTFFVCQIFYPLTLYI